MGDIDSYIFALDFQDTAKQICKAEKYLAIGIPSLACAQPCPAALVIFNSIDLIP